MKRGLRLNAVAAVEDAAATVEDAAEVAVDAADAAAIVEIAATAGIAEIAGKNRLA